MFLFSTYKAKKHSNCLRLASYKPTSDEVLMFSSSTFSSKATCCYNSIQIILFASEGHQRATTKTDIFIASHELCLGQKVALLLRDKHLLHLCINEQVVVVCICPSKRETRRPRTADIQTFVMQKQHLPTIFTPFSVATCMVSVGLQLLPSRWPRHCENICVLEWLMKNEKGLLYVCPLDFRHLIVFLMSVSLIVSDFSHWRALPQVQHGQSTEELSTRAN